MPPTALNQLRRAPISPGSTPSHLAPRSADFRPLKRPNERRFETHRALTTLAPAYGVRVACYRFSVVFVASRHAHNRVNRQSSIANSNMNLDHPTASLFLPYQLKWIEDDSPLRLAEKSVRIGWTYCDAFKNVRKRLSDPRRDYLFSSKDQGTAIEYVSTCYQFCELYNQTKAILSHGIEDMKAPIFKDGKNTGFTEEFKVGYIKFDNGSRILSFSSNPNALRAYGGDVGLDEFAFHHDAEALWSSASGRITWGFDLAIWSSHSGPDTLFNI